jgi:hypothetical protein
VLIVTFPSTTTSTLGFLHVDFQPAFSDKMNQISAAEMRHLHHRNTQTLHAHQFLDLSRTRRIELLLGLLLSGRKAYQFVQSKITASRVAAIGQVRNGPGRVNLPRTSRLTNHKSRNAVHFAAFDSVEHGGKDGADEAAWTLYTVG